ncbi:MAG: hypothetical protein ACRETL_13435 [Gammaproteobacteria bacterium]
MARVRRFFTALIRMTALPALRAAGGLIWTILVPTFRALAGVSIVIAAIALASDTGPIDASGGVHLRPTSVLADWQSLAPAALDATHRFVVKRMQPWVWEALSAPLTLPSFVVFLVLGLILGYLGRHRRQVAIFAN